MKPNLTGSGLVPGEESELDVGEGGWAGKEAGGHCVGSGGEGGGGVGDVGVGRRKVLPCGRSAANGSSEKETVKMRFENLLSLIVGPATFVLFNYEFENSQNTDFYKAFLIF